MFLVQVARSPCRHQNPHKWPDPITVDTTMLRRITHFLTEKTSPMQFAVLAGTAILLVSALSFSLPFAEPDLWGHVQFGRDTLEHGISKTTSYAFTAKGYPWVNHENLSEVAFAFAVDRLGTWSLLVGKCLLGILIVASIGWRARRNGASWLVTSAAIALFAATACPYWQVRPQISSFVCFALLILILDKVFNGWDQQWHVSWLQTEARYDRYRSCRIEKAQLNWLWLSVPLFAVWANAHGGFVLGYALFASYLALRSVEIWLTDAQNTRGQNAQETIVALAIIGTMAGLATFGTPYGLDLHRWLLASLGSPRPEIAEWHAFGFDNEAFLPFATLGLISLSALVFSRRALDATHLILIAVTCWQALLHQRHIPFAAMLICYWLPIHWNSLYERITNNDASDLAPKRWMQWGIVGVNILLLCAVLPRLAWLKVDRHAYPVSAIQYIHDQQIGGRVVVTYNWAQYLIGAFGESGVRPPSDFGTDRPSATQSRTTDDTGTVGQAPKIQVAFDGRFRTCYPQRAVDEHFDFILGPHSETGRFRTSNADPQRVLKTGDPELVLIRRSQVPSAEVMRAQDDWVLLYQDAIAQLWGRSDKFDDPDSGHYIAPESRSVGDRRQVGYVAWPALPRDAQSTKQRTATATVANRTDASQEETVSTSFPASSRPSHPVLLRNETDI